MNPNLMEQFLGPSTQFFCFNQNEINVVATPIDRKTCLLTKRNIFTTQVAKNSLKNPDIISSSYINNNNCIENNNNNNNNSIINNSFSSGIKNMRSSYTKFYHNLSNDELNDSNHTTTESDNQLDKTIDLEDDLTDNDVKNTSIQSIQSKSTTIDSNLADLSTISIGSIPTSTSTSNISNINKVTTMQRPPSSKIAKSSVPPRSSSAAGVRSISLTRTSNLITNANSLSNKGAGAVDENVFNSEFEKVPPINVYSARDVEQHINQICDSFNNVEDWAGRCNSMKKVRGLVIACREEYETEVFEAIKKIPAHFANQTKDLRSQIVREACITLAYLSITFGNRLDTFMEFQMTNLINLIQNSAKIMATSALISLRFIIGHTQTPKLVPFFATAIESKSKDIRRAGCEFINQICQTWEPNTIDKVSNQLFNSLKKGIVDADKDARAFARTAFWSYYNHYPNQAEIIINGLDPKTRDTLLKENKGMHGSVKSLNSGQAGMDQVDNKPKSTLAVATGSKMKRSTSAVDIKNARSNSSIGSRIPTPGEMAQRSQIATSRIPTSTSTIPTPSKASRIVQSQPGSRSTSPTPKYSYITNNLNSLNTSISSYTNGHMSPVLNNSLLNNLSNRLESTPPNYSHVKSKINSGVSQSAGSAKSKIPTSSRNSSRESSPGRKSNYGSERRPSVSKTPSRRPSGRTYSGSQDGDSSFSQSVTPKFYMKSRIRRGWDDVSDEASETSSLCSDRSFSSSIGGNRVTEDMNETITLLNSGQWTEKRDGLINVKLMIQANRPFQKQELKRLNDNFSKLFTEVNVKVFSTFLETLEVFIRANKNELKDWLSILLPRLLFRLGNENSQSLYSKLCQCLEAIRSSFDIDQQFKVLISVINEATTERSNVKSRIAILKYLQDIICIMEPCDFHANEEFKNAVGRIALFTTEPKSQETRRAAQAVLIGLFNLNTPEFSAMVKDLPPKIHLACTEILKTHMKNLTHDQNKTKKIPTSYSTLTKFKPASQFFNDYLTENSTQLSHVIKDIQNLNMNTNFSKKLDTLSKDSGMQSNPDVDSDSDGATSSVSSTSKLPSLSHIISILSLHQANPPSTSEKLKAMKDLTDLIKSGNRPECKWEENFKCVLVNLFNYFEQFSMSNENTLDQAFDTQTLLCLRELLQFQYKEFQKYTELTIVKLLSIYRETPQNELHKLVEDVVYTAARCLPPETTANVLKPIIEQAEYPKNLIAIRMLQKTVEQMSPELGNRLLNDMLSALLFAWDSPHSPVRKASVFCLVSLYMTIGDPLREHLNHLSSSKLKLLNVYINRAKESRETS
ncbi:unnamed protein product [Brachionus calyciflorus]|uniref:TOG domain-containing protein n=1 Tax=Brachionus calyciflorus TaxID=104777 RepID=A0A813LX55_9BILA|nr:unnamed protein product [Brachionus calyciflorus]